MGATGPQGLTGAPGPQGSPGATGPQGTPGTNGTNGTDGTPGVAGPQGPPGATGPQGPQGTAGSAGSQGPQGLTGATGPQGPQGVAGATGPQGPQGAQGATGSSSPNALSVGTNLGNADSTFQPGTDCASEYEIPANTLTGPHNYTAGIAGPPTTNLDVLIVCRDLSTNIPTILNGGASLGTVMAFPASRPSPMGMWIHYDGSNWYSDCVIWIKP